MLTWELMGLFALGVLWLNSGLVLAVAWRRLRALVAMRARLRDATKAGTLVRGRVAADVLATRTIAQTGRAITTKGPDRILFTDGPQVFEVHGGAVEVDGEVVRVETASHGESEVWLDRARVDEALSCPDAAAFEEAWEAGSKYKGYAREVTVEVGEGDEVWVHGRRDGDALGPWEDRPMVVSTVDPIAWTSAAIGRIWAFLALSAIGLVVVTGVALWPPHFGTVSTIGGALCLAYFLAIQPLGTALRDRVRTPARRLEGALWRRPE